MATAAVFAATIKCSTARITTANTARDGSGTLGTVFTAGASGSKVENIRVRATGSTSAGCVRLYVHDGTNARLLDEIVVDLITVAANVAAFSYTFDYSTGPTLLWIPTLFSIRASTHIGEQFDVTAIYADV